MTKQEARRCVAACSAYLQTRDDSPRAAGDLLKAVEVLGDHAAAEAIVKFLARRQQLRDGLASPKKKSR